MPAPEPVRVRVERLSTPVLRWLSARPKALLPVTVGVLLIAGLASPTPLGGGLLLVLLLVVGWLSYLSWPVLQPAQRLLRAATVGLLASIAFVRLVG